MKKLLYIFLGFSLMFGCSDDGDSDSNEPCPSQPSLQTNPVTQIELGEANSVSATLNGEIINNPIGVNCETLSITSQGFVWATNTLPTTEDESVSASGQNANASVSNLNPESTYYVRTYLTNPLGTFYGNEVFFETPEPESPVYLDVNGVTIKAKDWAEVGMSGEINGVTYTIVDKTTLDGMIDNGEDVTVVCTSRVTDMELMFYNTPFNQDISNWDVSSVTTMRGMFYGANDFNQDLSNWDVSSVIYMESMFLNCLDFNQDIGNWDVSSVFSMNGMFWQASSFNQPIGDWDVSNVYDMNWMFHNAYSFNQDISNWDVSFVNGMQNMFRSSPSGETLFNQDLSDWDVSNEPGCTDFCLGATNWTLPKPNFLNNSNCCFN
jgi:surface protein